MKTYIRRKEINENLIVLYGGWGVDENVFTPLYTGDFDFILFYNYSADEALVLPETKKYNSIILIGWSLGVWAAEYLSPKTGIIPDISIAVNGTPVPASDNYGIPLNIIEGTLNNITEKNMGKFYRRMFGDQITYRLNADRIPGRSIKSLRDELRWLYNRIMEQKDPGFRWDFAVTSEIDRVFPASNMQDYWSTRPETTHIIVPKPHYLFHEWDSFKEFADWVINYKKDEAKD